VTEGRIALMSKFLLAAGFVFVLYGLGADALGLSEPGLGPRQTLMTMAGFVLLAAGLGLGRHRDWHQLNRTHSALPAGKLLVLACWFGLLAGLAETLALCARHWLFGYGLSFNQHHLWMKPVANTILFCATGLVLSIAAKWLPSVASVTAATFIFVFLGATAALLQLPDLDIAAKMILAAGFAVAVARMGPVRLERLRGVAGRTLPLVVGLAAALAIAVWAHRRLPEPLPTAQSSVAGKPNVLFIVLDTVRAKSLSAYGYDRPTSPRLEEFTERAVVFERAFSTAPWTLSSHGSMFSGRHGREIFAADDTPLTSNVALQSSHPMLAEVLGGLGYETAAFVGNPHYCDRAHGLSAGFSRYDDYGVSVDEFMVSSQLLRLVDGLVVRPAKRNDATRKSAAEVNSELLGWLDDREQRPFFAFLNYYDAHNPYVVPPPFEVRYGANRPKALFDLRQTPVPAEEIPPLIDGYDSCLIYLDHHVGALLDQLAERGVLQDTLVIITSDHGEMLGEGGFVSHDYVVYRPALHVPLMFSFPSRIPINRRVAEPVSLRNLPATIMELIGLQDESPFPTSSLVPLWDGRGTETERAEPLFSEVLVRSAKPLAWAEWFPGWEAGLQSLIANGHHYIRYQRDGVVREELYDLEDISDEPRDLAMTPQGSALLPGFRSILEAIPAAGSDR